MPHKKITLLYFFSFCSILCIAQLKSPADYLGYSLGSKFSRHYQVVDYFHHVDSMSDRVVVKKYGETYENRPLIYAVISTPENIAQLETIRNNNLGLSGLTANNNPFEKKVAIVWLSYNVHGNESVSTEAALETIHKLADTTGQYQKYLDNVVVIIDPCINPDGRERYVNWYYQFGNQQFNPDPNSKEHHEPWLNGRTNHYMFDLNRDWAWVSQKESINRVKLYNQWLPQVHVDFHEQSIDAPYYFAPAAEPFHEIITPWQREFQITIGKNNAKYFDENGWLYFTKEVFDLLYPSYGDTYPTYNGAIGMTYEQGGSGAAGLGVTTAEGDTLTLQQRISHHVVTGLSTIEVTSRHAEKVLQEFEKYFQSSINNPPVVYNSYVIKYTNDRDKMNQLMAFLNTHKISFGSIPAPKNSQGYAYLRDQNENFVIAPNDLVINVHQSKSNLIKALFEPKTRLVDSLTYDITAWSVPFGFGLNAFATGENIIVGEYNRGNPVNYPSENNKVYAYVSKWASIEDVKWLGRLITEGVKVRFATASFVSNNQKFERGSLIITKRGNESFGKEFEQKIIGLAKEHNREIIAVQSGLVSEGKDFGSNSVRYIKPPKIAVISGKGISPNAFGEIWYYFEQRINYPVTILDTDYLEAVDLSAYNIIIFPDLANSDFFDAALKNRLKQWVDFGGKLVLLEDAVSKFESFKNHKNTKNDKSPEGNLDIKIETEKVKKIYENRERDAIKDLIVGSIFKTSVDNSHPLGFGYGSTYYTLKRNAERVDMLKDGWNVFSVDKNVKTISGFAGFSAINNIENSLVFGVDESGKGSIVYMVDNPIFRSFWHNGELLFGNAIFLVNN